MTFKFYAGVDLNKPKYLFIIMLQNHIIVFGK